MRAIPKHRLEAVLARGRAAAEARMFDEWVIGTLGDWVYNDETGEDEQVFTELFRTRARLRDRETVSTSEGGDRTIVTTRRTLHIPVDSPVVPVGAVAKCVWVHPTSDPTLLGVRVKLAGPAPGAQTTARRLEVVEVLT